MKLSIWIKEVGQSNLAKKLSINEATISHWQKYKTLPRPKVMKKIVRLSCGAVTYKEMIEEYIKHNGGEQ